MVTAAKGAEKFYALDSNATRTEGIEIARQLDKKTSNVWIGHPYIDVIDNSTDFEMKIARVLKVRANDVLNFNSNFKGSN